MCKAAGRAHLIPLENIESQKGYIISCLMYNRVPMTISLFSFEILCYFRLSPPSTTWLWQFLILKQRHLQVPAFLQGFSLKLPWLGQFVSLFSCFGGLDPVLFTLWWQTRFPLNTVLIPFSMNRSLTCVSRVVKLFSSKLLMKFSTASGEQ